MKIIKNLEVSSVSKFEGYLKKCYETPQLHHRKLMSRIVGAYGSLVARSYCRVRFTIIDIKILNMLSLFLRGKTKILDIGCGYGLFGCYFSTLYPEIPYYGYDIDSKRIEMAKLTAMQLGLKNVSFHCQDVRALASEDMFDAIVMIDLLHHIDNDSKRRLLAKCLQHLSPNGSLIIKEVSTRPFHKMLFTWVLDVLVTRSFQMWYWNEEKFRMILKTYFNRVDTYPIAHWLPYPHVIYLCENTDSLPDQ